MATTGATALDRAALGAMVAALVADGHTNTSPRPEREKPWSTERAADRALTVREERAGAPSYAFLGVHPCDLRAIVVRDRVLVSGHYTRSGCRERRRGAFLIAAECTEPGGTRLCVSMGSGPAAEDGYDLALTEVVSVAGHRFLGGDSGEGGEGGEGERNCQRLTHQLPDPQVKFGSSSRNARRPAGIDVGTTNEVAALQAELPTSREEPRR